MRQSALLIVSLLVATSAGCRMLDPNSPLNVNRGAYSDEYTARNEGRASESLEHEDMEGADPWLMSPKARAINAHLGVD